MTSFAHRQSAGGFSLLEVLIAMIVLAFGMLALVRSIGRASQAEFEAVQRTQAMQIAQDMVDRINLNRKLAGNYVGDYVPGTTVDDCAGKETQVARDQCEWTNRLLGADTLDDKKLIGAPVSARGCVVLQAPRVYLVSVAWTGMVDTIAPDSPCGEGKLGDETKRRVFSTVVHIADLGA